MSRHGPARLRVEGAERSPERDGVEAVRLLTDGGAIPGRLHPAEGEAAILWVFGSGGGLGGPAGGVYTRLGGRLGARGVASLELDYRHPGRLAACVADALAGLDYLEGLGHRRLVLVGHSFGGAVAVNAGALSPLVVAIAALSSQDAGAEAVSSLSPRPMLFVHGTADEVLPDLCSRRLHARAGEPKELVLYPGCGHGLDACRDALDRDLTAWLERVLGPAVG